MATYNFDKIINRKGTNCLKYDYAVERGKPADVLPLWVADMDFTVSEEITKSLHAAVDHGIYGYTQPKDAYYNAITNWMEKNHNWKTKREWIMKTPGVVFALGAAVKAFTKPGDAVLIQNPVYYPFTNIIRDNDRRVIDNTLVYEKRVTEGKSQYSIDYEDFERKIVQENIKLFILCNPHNPVGRVWNREELQYLGEICLRHHVIVVSDEIHNDFVYPGFEHTVFANVDPRFAEFTVTCTAPSKTFNLAGLIGSYHIVYNETLHKRMKKESSLSHYNSMNVLSMHALIGAYSDEGSQWVDELREVLTENVKYACRFIRKNLQGVSVQQPEGTYMLFLDCEEYCRRSGRTLDEVKKAGYEVGVVWQDGRPFHGAHHIRMNLALPMEKVVIAMDRLKEYVFI